MTQQQTPQPTDGEPTSADLANMLRARLAELGTDVDDIPGDENDIAGLLRQLNSSDRDRLCELISLRAGRLATHWPKWLDQLHDEAGHSDAIGAARKTLEEHLATILAAVKNAQATRRQLQGNRGGMYDVEHAEGGATFQIALDKLAFYAEAAQALNPTKGL